MASASRANGSSRPAVHFAAGLTTGVVSAALLQPADLLKTRLQQAQHTSLSATLRDMSHRGPHGLLQLWRGTLPSVLRTGLGSALYFTSLDAMRRGIARSGTAATRSTPWDAASGGGGGSTSPTSALPRLSHTANLLSGALARTAAGMVLMPLTVLKVRYESDLYAYTTLRRAARGIWQTEGLRGFFAGVGATALRDAPYAGLYVLFYEQAKTSLSRQLDEMQTAMAGVDGSGAAFVVTSGGDEKGVVKTRVAAPVNFLSGILAGAAATAITNPFDAVKTRLQLRPKEYRSLWRATSLMVRDEGIRSLFDGLALRMARKAMSSAVAWTLYEELVRFAETRV